MPVRKTKSAAAAPAASTSTSSSAEGTGNFKHVGNKMKRQQLYRAHRKSKREDKLKRRVAQAKDEKQEGGAERKRARLAANIPRTIERTRDYNPTIISAPNSHDGPAPFAASSAQSTSAATLDDDDDENDKDEQDVEDEEKVEEQDEEDDPHAAPAILITTTMPSNSTSPHLSSANARSHPAERTRDFVNALLDVFPGAEYRARAKAKGVGLGKIAGWARDRGYNAMLVVGEDKKEPFSLTLIGLPNGPTAFFRLTNISLTKEIEGHARSTKHTPELILNNFTTTLGYEVGGLLQTLFPRIPQLEGRQVVTAHNQRDYIFFRRHRYMFSSDEKARLQEIGPRFTLKLRTLKNGLPKGAGVWDGEVHFDGRQTSSAGADATTTLAMQKDAADSDAVAVGADASTDATDSRGAMLDTMATSAATMLKSTPRTEDAPIAAAANKRKRAQRGHEENVGLSYEWKPKMGVSRRNFYL